MVHQYKNNGYDIVLDVNSGSVHVVDDIVYDCIALLDQGCSNEEVTEKLSASYSGEDLKTALKEIQHEPVFFRPRDTSRIAQLG